MLTPPRSRTTPLVLAAGRRRCQPLLAHRRHTHSLLPSSDAGARAAGHSPAGALGRPCLHLQICPAGSAEGDELHARTPGTTLPTDSPSPEGPQLPLIPLGIDPGTLPLAGDLQVARSNGCRPDSSWEYPLAHGWCCFLGRLSFHSKAHPCRSTALSTGSALTTNWCCWSAGTSSTPTSQGL